MDPIAIVFALALGANTNHDDFKHREKARLALEEVAPTSAMPAFLALSVHREIEISESAKKIMGRWRGRWYEAKLKEFTTTEDMLIWAAINGPAEDQPWRALDEYEDKTGTEKWDNGKGQQEKDRWREAYLAKVTSSLGDRFGSGPINVLSNTLGFSAYGRCSLGANFVYHARSKFEKNLPDW